MYVYDLADGQGVAGHDGRHRDEDARPGRVRRPGGDGPAHRLLVVARTASTSPTRRPTTPASRRGTSPTRSSPDAEAAPSSSTRGPARRTSRCGSASSRSTGGETVWVEWDAKKYEYLAAVRWDEARPARRFRCRTASSRSCCCSRSTRRPARRRRCSTEKDAGLAQPRARTCRAGSTDGGGFVWVGADANGDAEIQLRNDGRRSLPDVLVRRDATSGRDARRRLDAVRQRIVVVRGRHRPDAAARLPSQTRSLQRRTRLGERRAADRRAGHSHRGVRQGRRAVRRHLDARSKPMPASHGLRRRRHAASASCPRSPTSRRSRRT